MDDQVLPNNSQPQISWPPDTIIRTVSAPSILLRTTSERKGGVEIMMLFSLVASQVTMKVPDVASRSIAPEFPEKINKGREEHGTRTGRRRRSLLSMAAAVAATVVLPEASESSKTLLQGYLERTKRNKEKNDKERLDDYYRRNYKDYFDLLDVQGKEDSLLSETQKGIRDWLRANK